MKLYIDVGLRIKKIRNHKKISREELSESTKISAKYLYEIENGKRKFSAHVLLAISEELEVPTDYLLGRSGFASIVTILDDRGNGMQGLAQHLQAIATIACKECKKKKQYEDLEHLKTLERV